MDQDSKKMTLEDFLALSPEQRRAMTAKESGPFYAQLAVRAINEATRNEPDPHPYTPIPRKPVND